MMLHQLHSPGGIRFFRGQCGWTRLRADVEVVWTAIQQSPNALAFADAKLRRNKPLVLQAPFDGRKMGWLLSGLVIIFNICNHLQCGAFLNGHLNLFKQAFCEDIVRISWEASWSQYRQQCHMGFSEHQVLLKYTWWFLWGRGWFVGIGDLGVSLLLDKPS